MSNEIQSVVTGGGMLTAFHDIEQMYRVSTYLAKSPIVPAAFRDNPGSVMIALNMAARLRMDPLMVMQNIVVVNRNAGMSGKFAIALLNRSSKYRRIEYRFVNGKDYSGGMQVVGYRVDDPKGESPDVGTAITPEMASAEGWMNNPKWKSMPEQMMRYRAAAFFARAYVPEELMGMQTAEELEDVEAEKRQVRPAAGRVVQEAVEPMLFADDPRPDSAPAAPEPMSKQAPADELFEMPVPEKVMYDPSH